MPKNRDYTGLVRTPASMAWLIRERARLKGQLDRRKKQLEELPRQIVDLEQRLAALDKVFELHEVRVEPTRIRGTKPQSKALLPYGVMTKSILKYLRENAGSPRCTTEIALHVIRSAGLDPTSVNKARFVERVQKRLKNLRTGGLIQSHHPTGPGIFVEGSWSLAAEDQVTPSRNAA